MDPHALAKKIIQTGNDSRLDAFGIADASAFESYLQADSIRRDPRLSIPGARSIIVAGVYIGGVILKSWQDASTGRTSRLFLSGFFNDVVKELNPVVRLLQAEGYSAEACNDSLPNGSIIPLKLAAIRTGVGWQGKNSLLVNRRYGTFLALGGIVTDALLEPSGETQPDRCGTCTKCQEVCPVGALDQAHILDRTKCLSYLLQQSDLPEQLNEVVGNRIMDCEICQDVCPWNQRHVREPLQTRVTTSFQRQASYWENWSTLSKLAAQTEKEYESTFGKLETSIPFSIFHRNVQIALHNYSRPK